MKGASAGYVLDCMRQLCSERDRTVPEGELLDRFARGDESAFTELLRRHGPLVWGACRRVLGNAHDAEDAFQATFLLLARRAARLRRSGSLAGWLHAVSWRLARQALREEKRRRRRECNRAPPKASLSEDSAWREFRLLLDAELARLPRRYREPLILCYLEGLTQAEAARRLGWSEGMLHGTLERGRQALRRRLTRLGMPLAAPLLLLGPAVGVSAALSAATMATIRAALAGGPVAPAISSLLASGSVFLGLAKWKLAVASILLASAVGFGAAKAFYGADEPPIRPPLATHPASRTAEQPKARVDAVGDPLPQGAIQRFGTIRARHGKDTRGIGSSALSPDGKYLATTASHSVVVWDLETSKPVHHFRSDQGSHFSIPGIAFSPDGKRLGFVRGYTFACVWDLATGKELWRPHRDFQKHPNSLCHFTPDGKQLILGDETETHFWDLASGKQTRVLPVGQIALLSPDARKYVRRGVEQALIVGDCQTGKETTRLDAKASIDIQSCVAFTPDGKTLAAVHQNKEIQIREVEGGKLLASFPLPNSALYKTGYEDHWQYHVGFSRDGKVLLLGTYGGIIHRWDLATRNELPPLGKHLREVTGLHTLPDGRTLVSTGSDGVIRRWDLQKGKELSEPECYAGRTSAAYSPNAGLTAVGDGRGRLDLWDLRTGRRLKVLRQSGAPVNNLEFSPDAKLLAGGLSGGHIALWDVNSGTELKKVKWEGTLGSMFAQTLLFSPDGKSLCVSDYPRQMRFIGVSTGKEIWHNKRAGMNLSGGMGGPAAAAIPPDVAAVAVAFDGPHLSFLDAATGQERSRVRLNPDANHSFLNVAQALAFSPDGRKIAAGLQDGHVSVCDARTGEVRRGFRAVEPPEGDLLAREIFRMGGSKITALSFSPDGKWLLSGEPDTTVRIWEVATGKEAFRLDGHEGTVTRLGFTPDMQAIFSGADDGQAYLWSARPQPTQKEFSPEELWNELVAAEAARGYRAVWAVYANADAMAAFLRRQIVPAKSIDEARHAKLVADLDSEEFATRETAAKALGELGARALPTIEKALKARPSPETGRRLQMLLSELKAGPGPEEIRRMRAVQGLELAATSTARAVLREWASGVADDHLTIDAKAALARLKVRPESR